MTKKGESDRIRNTPMSRAEAQVVYTTCAICAHLLPTTRIYVCSTCAAGGSAAAMMARVAERRARVQAGLPEIGTSSYRGS